MIRNQKGGVVTLVIGAIALVALSAAVYYFSLSRTTNNDVSVGTKKVPAEIQNDSDGLAADKALDSANSTNLSDTEPTADDLGI